MEDLASKAIQANVVSQVEGVFDQFVNFISLENDMFMLRKTSGSKDQSLSFQSLNKPETTDTQMEDILNQVCSESASRSSASYSQTKKWRKVSEITHCLVAGKIKPLAD